jgi:beta-phosphoglucomutase-like phosphatase (HAD superfamily)
MPDLARPAAIVFDLDGTLVDTVGARIAGWEAAAAEALRQAGASDVLDTLDDLVVPD